ncbi:MAG: hypothetical protein ACTSO7_00800 [Candidatus Heimdallarchaeota archaeon]
MPETAFKENIAKLNTIYLTLIKQETNPGMEAEHRVEIIDILSNLEASIIGVKSKNEEFIALLAKVKEGILEWNAHGSLFKHQIGIVDLLNEVFFKAKSVVFSTVEEEIEKTEALPPEPVVNENDRSEATRLKKELASMKSELGDLKDLISSLMKEKEKQNSAAPQQPGVEEPPQEVISPVTTEETKPKSQLPWKKQPEPVVVSTEVAEEPPILLPIVSEDTPKETIKEIQTPPVVEEESAPDEAAFEPSSTIRKLSEKQKPETETAHIIDQMKSIITEAEEKTREEISAFKNQMAEKSKPQVTTPTQDQSIVEEKIIPPTTEAPTTESNESKIAIEQETPIIPPTEPTVVEETPTEPDTDPYMLLLTLEAEKYRLEKEIEKNETDFQEGLKNRQEFDDNIRKINSDLGKVREQIDLLRQKLIS